MKKKGMIIKVKKIKWIIEKYEKNNDDIKSIDEEKKYDYRIYQILHINASDMNSILIIISA